MCKYSIVVHCLLLVRVFSIIYSKFGCVIDLQLERPDNFELWAEPGSADTQFFNKSYEVQDGLMLLCTKQDKYSGWRDNSRHHGKFSNNKCKIGDAKARFASKTTRNSKIIMFIHSWKWRNCHTNEWCNR